METAPPLNQENGSRERAACGVTVVYEDVESAIRAKRFAEMLGEACGAKESFHATYWHSMLLGVPEVEEEIEGCPLVGEFLIVCLRGDSPLTDVTRHAITRWLKTSANKSVSMIALFDPKHCHERTARQIRTTLQKLAANAGVAFFTQMTAGEENYGSGSYYTDENLSNQRMIIASYLPIETD